MLAKDELPATCGIRYPRMGRTLAREAYRLVVSYCPGWAAVVAINCSPCHGTARLDFQEISRPYDLITKGGAHLEMPLAGEIKFNRVDTLAVCGFCL
jgi:hypothetical protein